MSGISLQIGSIFANQVPARPGPPFLDWPMWIANSVGQVLKMDTRIADKSLVRCVLQYPGDTGIGQGPFFQWFFVSSGVGEEGPVDGEQASSWCIIHPEILGVFETTKVEVGSTISSALSNVFIVQGNVQIRQVGTWSACFHTGRQCTARFSARTPFDLGLNCSIYEGRFRFDDGNFRAGCGHDGLWCDERKTDPLVATERLLPVLGPNHQASAR